MVKYENLFSLLVLASVFLSACQPAAPFECTDAIGCVSIPPGEPLKLGVLQTLSGGVAAAGADQVRGQEGPALDELISAYEARYDESPRTNTPVQAFDATNLLLNGIEAVAVKDASVVGTLHIGRQALREALVATTDLEGVAGMHTCDEFGDCSAARFHVMRLDDPAAGLEGLMSNVIYYLPVR